MMLSGLGPTAELAKYSIPVVVDLPGVGAHLMDHVVVDALYKDTSRQSLTMLRPRSIGEVFRAIPHVLRWLLSGKGGLTCQVQLTAVKKRCTHSSFLWRCRSQRQLRLCARTTRRCFLMRERLRSRIRRRVPMRLTSSCLCRRLGTATTEWLIHRLKTPWDSI
jgi:hypothetical protein